jgi:hypothetical protein
LGRPLQGRPGPATSKEAGVARLFHLQVDTDALTDEMFAFVTDPRPTRNDREVVAELHEYLPDAVPVLEKMLIDGVDERRHIADYVQWTFGRRFT